jgi:hypothetical protein
MNPVFLNPDPKDLKGFCKSLKCQQVWEVSVFVIFLAIFFEESR